VASGGPAAAGAKFDDDGVAVVVGGGGVCVCVCVVVVHPPRCVKDFWCCTKCVVRRRSAIKCRLEVACIVFVVEARRDCLILPF
jgi:hypothetical protein